MEAPEGLDSVSPHHRGADFRRTIWLLYARALYPLNRKAHTNFLEGHIPVRLGWAWPGHGLKLEACVRMHDERQETRTVAPDTDAGNILGICRHSLPGPSSHDNAGK